jgi:peptidoglycan/xylan/chitin deacetylase (PgdA/CDA1 family)
MKTLLILLLTATDLLPIKTVHSSAVQPPIKQVPVLTYHNINKYPAKENLLFTSEKTFALQMKALYDSGFHTILPDDLAAYYNGRAALPAKPIIISFDDSHIEQFTLAEPILKRYGFKAVFFVMTVTIDKKGFLTGNQIKQLAQQGHIIGAHTWDHPNLRHQQPRQRSRQLLPPKKMLEGITGKPVDCFAYPFGAWDENMLAEIGHAGYITAFQLSGKCSNNYPLLTIKRIMVNGAWSPKKLLHQTEIDFL